jgi:hypothetical protein
MQTFLPIPNFCASAAVLDRQRLGKQRVEAKQILRVLVDEHGLFGAEAKPNWTEHPAVKMWRGHEVCLGLYGVAMCEEWRRRGFQDNTLDQICMLIDVAEPSSILPPDWLGREDFHLSHKSRLIMKFPEHYGPLWPDVKPGLPYVWPV